MKKIVLVLIAILALFVTSCDQPTNSGSSGGSGEQINELYEVSVVEYEFYLNSSDVKRTTTSSIFETAPDSLIAELLKKQVELFKGLLDDSNVELTWDGNNLLLGASDNSRKLFFTTEGLNKTASAYNEDFNRFDDKYFSWEYKDSVLTIKEEKTKPVLTVNKSFFMGVEDVFDTPTGTVVTGGIDRGIINVGDTVEIVGITATKRTVVTSIAKGFTEVDSAEEGENVGLILQDIAFDAVERGQIICESGTMLPYSKFEAEIYMYTKEEGSGRTLPINDGYRPTGIWFRHLNTTGEITFPEGLEVVSFGDNAKVTVTLLHPKAMELGSRFVIREGGRTVISGVVSKVIE